MQLASRVLRPWAVVPGLALAAVLACGAHAQDNKKDKDKDKVDTSRKFRFDTFDGATLSATFYPKLAGAKDKDACVMLLHNIDRVKGGNSHQDGWDHLAEELQKDGYTVLSFDFRGFGDSKEISNKDRFWSSSRAPQNLSLPGAKRQQEAIEFKEFPRSYYTMLANDIAAARNTLDHKNDAREINSSNIILIGAGEGAALGSLWLSSECKRKRFRGYLNNGTLDLDDPECRDVACALWLSISDTIGGMRMPVSRWLVEAGAEHRIPIGFLYGADDAESKGLSTRYASAINNSQFARKAKLEFTAAAEVPGTRLRGSQLLTKSLSTEQMIKTYLDKVMERRGTREPRSRDPGKTVYYWAFQRGSVPLIAKSETEDLLRALPLSHLGANQ